MALPIGGARAFLRRPGLGLGGNAGLGLGGGGGSGLGLRASDATSGLAVGAWERCNRVWIRRVLEVVLVLGLTGPGPPMVCGMFGMSMLSTVPDPGGGGHDGLQFTARVYSPEAPL